MPTLYHVRVQIRSGLLIGRRAVADIAAMDGQALPPGFQPLDRLAGWVRIALLVAAALYALGASAYPGNVERMNAAEADARAMGYDGTLRATPIGKGIAIEDAGLLVAFALLVFFLYRAYDNTRVLDPRQPRWASGWAIGYWFIPILSFFRPKQVANAAYRAGEDVRVPAVFHWWWALWLLGPALYIGARRTLAGAQTWSDLQIATGQEAIGELTMAAALVLAAVVVTRITRRQDRRARGITQRNERTFLASPERVLPQAG